MTETNQLVSTIIDGIQEKKGHGIVTVNMQSIVSAPCTYFVICTGGSPQQVDAIADSVEEFARKRAGEKPSAITGRTNGQWVAMDYGTVMVHVFQKDAREFYDLEHLWNDATLTEVADLD